MRGCSADYDATSQRSKWNSERKTVKKCRVPRLPACPVRAASPRGLLGPGKATRVRWRRVGGAADSAFGSPRLSRLAQKQTGSRGNLGQAQIIKGRNQMSAPTAWNSRAVSTVWLIPNLFAWFSCRARDEFYLHHLGEPIPNEKNCQANC